ncbi:hypothetical protein SK128_025696 [Halocaridina rubra]|uniref:C2H2-type domain-containing protein n=1 Tax=Halocaridina rubra TaxID=373956 RepID=A0AAN8WLI7_HALRR
MSGRSRGKPFRGIGRGSFRGGGQWRGQRGGMGGFHGGNHRGGRGGGYRGGVGVGRQDHFHVNREMRGGSSQYRHHDSRRYLSSLDPEDQFALTSAIIKSFLKTDGREGRANFRDEKEYHPGHRGGRREGRGGYFSEEQRDRRHSDDRRPHDSRIINEGRGHRYEREKSTQGPPRYRNNRYSSMHRRRPSPHGHMGQAQKRMRMERMDGDSGPHHSASYERDDMGSPERKRPRDDKRESPGQNRERNGREDERRRRSSSGKEGSVDGSRSMQVTLRADGERNVSNEGNGRAGGIHFVELICPYCPGKVSITFKEYKFHLLSEAHKNQLNRLARKHSVVLRKIRVQQRQEQRDIEDKWKEEKPEEFQDSVTRFCNNCKLAYKCPGDNTSEGISQHNDSKLHRVQHCYLYPRCGACRTSFPSRMVYEHHLASIHHLRTLDRMGRKQRDDIDQDDDNDQDLANFLTLDAVGEDDEVGSEHEEITAGLDDTGPDKEAELRRKPSLKNRFERHSLSDDEESVDTDWGKDKYEEDEEENEPVGADYVYRVAAYYCRLCSKVFRADTSLGSRAVQRHCKTFEHAAHYQDTHPPSAEKEEENVSDGIDETEEHDAVSKDGSVDDDEPEQDKLWEEVRKGEVVTEAKVDGDDTTVTVEDDDKANKEKTSKVGNELKSYKEDLYSDESENELETAEKQRGRHAKHVRGSSERETVEADDSDEAE